MRYAQSLEAQSIYYFHQNGRPRLPCKPLKRKPPGLIRVAVENHLPLDLFKIYGIIYLSWHHLRRGRLTAGAWCRFRCR
ncbi:hypothetical protein COI38_06115 [Neisseria meningitidis]|nr:hypothetical protein COI38_06115 [Neisseria meningitidis]